MDFLTGFYCGGAFLYFIDAWFGDKGDYPYKSLGAILCTLVWPCALIWEYTSK